MERWKRCPAHAGYEVSDHGRVRNRDTQHVLCPIHNRGYPQLNLRRDGRADCWRVHQLVAATFFGPAEGREVNHKNGDKRDNRVSNLEYVTREENQRHATDVLRATRGSRNGRARLTEKQVREIKRRLNDGETGIALAREFGVHRNTIYQMRYGNNWSHTGASVTRGGYCTTLTAKQVYEIANRHAAGETVRSLAREFGVSVHTLYRRGLTCAHRASGRR